MVCALGGAVWFPGADGDMAQLELTNQLFDPELGELAVIARGQPGLVVGDIKVVHQGPFSVQRDLGWALG